MYSSIKNARQYELGIIVNEFGDKSDLETGPKWAQFGPNYFFRML